MHFPRLLSLSLMLVGASVTSALQFCQVVPEYKTDLCLAVTSGINTTTGKNDLSMHMSVDFKDRVGWAAVGVGEEMSGALMFVMFPGAKVGGKSSIVNFPLPASHKQMSRDINRMSNRVRTLVLMMSRCNSQHTNHRQLAPTHRDN